MHRILVFALLLSQASPALATGQEMAGLEVYLAAYVSLIAGLAIGAAIVVILLLVTGLRGTLRQHPVRVGIASVVILAAAPFVIFMGFVLTATIEDMRKYPAQYAWLTGWTTANNVTAHEDVTAQPVDKPSVDLLTQARNGLALLSQDIVRAWHYDSDVEEAERRASQGGAGADDK